MLEPCPFCGVAPEIQTKFEIEGDLAENQENYVHVICPTERAVKKGCGAMSKGSLTVKEAVSSWNRRVDD